MSSTFHANKSFIIDRIPKPEKIIKHDLKIYSKKMKL